MAEKQNLPRKISRRDFFRIAVPFTLGIIASETISSGALKLLGLTTPDISDLSDYFPNKPEAWFKFPQHQVLERKIANSFDIDYLSQLVNKLTEKNEADANELAKSVLDSTRVLTYTNQEVGTMVEIDESGYYLTCRHLFNIDPKSSNKKAQTDFPVCVLNPRTGEANQVSNLILSKEKDLAIVCAPTGRIPKPTKGINFSTKDPALDQELWMYAINNKSSLAILHGSVNKFGENLVKSEGNIPVKGMIPFGGSSGSPVINKSGQIVGVESGPIMPVGKENKRENYVGSSVESINKIQELITSGAVFDLEAKSN